MNKIPKSSNSNAYNTWNRRWWYYQQRTIKTETTGKLGDNCIVFENFTVSIGDLMVANWVYWKRVNGAGSKLIFATIKLTIGAVKFSNTIQLSPF